MHQIRVFISSVQHEFAEERTALYDYLHEDPVLGRFFLPFIFEKSPATDDSAKKVYLAQSMVGKIKKAYHLPNVSLIAQHSFTKQN